MYLLVHGSIPKTIISDFNIMITPISVINARFWIRHVLRVLDYDGVTVYIYYSEELFMSIAGEYR